MATPTRATFPLVPRYRLTGLPFGSARSTRRGRGSDLAGFRAYVPGDPIATIDWRASAKLSSARGNDEFVVRERFADEAPVVIIVADRRPSMGLYPDWSPWLAKPRALRAAAEAIGESAVAARGALGYVDGASRPDGGQGPFWLAPRARAPLEPVEARVNTAPFDAPAGSLESAFGHPVRSRSSLGAGSFVFVLSDFLEPPPQSLWLTGLARRWELVPVVIQDPTWEQDFPHVGPVILPAVDPRGGALLDLRLTRSEARAERGRRQRARAELLAAFARLGLDPVLLSTSDPALVRGAFHDWAERRRRVLWRRS